MVTKHTSAGLQSVEKQGVECVCVWWGRGMSGRMLQRPLITVRWAWRHCLPSFCELRSRAQAGRFFGLCVFCLFALSTVYWRLSQEHLMENLFPEAVSEIPQSKNTTCPGGRWVPGLGPKKGPYIQRKARRVQSQGSMGFMLNVWEMSVLQAVLLN